MIALLDADVLVYRVGFTTQEDPEWVAKARLDETILNITADLMTEEYVCILSPTGRKTFRYEIYPEYKANRKQPKPVHYDFIRKVLVEHHDATIADGEEADDLLGKLSVELDNPEYGASTCIVSVDKDLNQLPGWHYNFVKKLKYFIEPIEGMKFFYQQMLMGDTSDNIPGIYNIGPARAAQAIDPCKTEEEMLSVVRARYDKEFGSESEAIFRRNATLLKIRGTPRYLWESND